MKPICRELQEQLAGEGAQGLRANAAAQRHLEECTECFQVLERLARLDEALSALPALDASERVVSELLARVESEAAGPAAEPSRSAPRRWLDSLAGAARRRAVPRPVLWGLATAASVVFALSMLTPSLFRARIAMPESERVPDAFVVDGTQNMPPATLVPGADRKADRALRDSGVFEGRGDLAKDGRLTAEEADKLRALGYVGDAAVPGESARKPEPKRQEAQAGSSASDVNLDAEIQSRSGPVEQGERSNEYSAQRKLQVPPAKAGEKDAGKERRSADLDDTRGVEGGVPGGVVGGVVGGLPDVAPGQRPVRVGGALKAPKQIRRVDPAYPEEARRAGIRGEVILEIEIGVSGKVTRAKVLRSVPLLDAAALEAVKQWVYVPTVLNGQSVPVIMTVTISFRLPEPPQEEPGSSEHFPTEPVRAFLEERVAIEGVSFQPASGYWANTYLPGDPALRLLHARLLAWDRSPLQAQAGFPLRLHDAAAPPAQPFDAPRSAGLAAYLHADRRGLDKPSRMLVQVGLKGSPRSGRQRPSMNVGLVLDLRADVPVEAAADMRALALAFSEAREVGDRFSLIVAGRPGGVAVGPDKFKHGPLAVTLDRLLTGAASETGQALTLPDAVAAALVEASQRDDPDAALGSSAVVLVTGQPLGDSVDALADLAHQGAVAGIPLSVVGVGSGAPLAQLDRLALIGQGSRRLLGARSDASRLVEAELAAASDAVARAVRLRIRLAPGVRLVGIVGSRRLDDAQAQRVRKAERSIDLRLSRNLGIESDRGEDEAGIQVVIPVFHAGDAHVILLDVVAQGPGAVVDVSVRYKDLVFLRNGVARASLLVPRLPDGAGSLSAGATAAGPLERNVLKNLLALRLAQTLADAGSALEAGDAAEAVALVERAGALRGGLIACVPGLAGDVELARDVAMLGEYARLLAGGRVLQPQLAYIADSLRYAGRLKRLPRPAPPAAGVL